MAYNHIIPTDYFDDCIEEFTFYYDWYHVSGMITDDYGNQKNQFTKMTIKGSIQPNTHQIKRDTQGNIISMSYDFYCKSIYRIGINDFIFYNNDWLICNSVSPYDEYGVRKVSLESANVAQYSDMLEAVKALTGEVIV